MKPDELLEYAAKDPATWSKDDVRRLLREAAAAITKQQQDAERYRWLRDNAGAWEVSRDPSEWTRVESGEKFRPGVYFTAYSTGYGGRCLDDAIDAAMAGANAGIEPNRPR